MPLYEMTFITRQDVSTKESDAISDKITSIIQNNQGQLLKKEYWGFQNLAYSIKKNRKGHYFQLTVDSNSESIDEIRRIISIDGNIIRHMMIRIDNFDQKPSPMMFRQRVSNDSKKNSGENKDGK